MNKYLKLTISVVTPLLVGAVGSFFTSPEIAGWYASIQKPSFNPPNWIFGPVWTILFILIGISFFLIWNKKPIYKIKPEATLYYLQLGLNLLWSILFFGFHKPFLSLIEIIVLWICILTLMVRFFRISKLASYLLIPYLLWVSFAAILNFMIVKLN